jgi:hypothetical protein
LLREDTYQGGGNIMFCQFLYATLLHKAIIIQFMETAALQRDILLFLYEQKEKEDYVIMHPVLIKYLESIEIAKRMLEHLHGIGIIKLKLNDPITNSEAKLDPIKGEKYVRVNYIHV